jgi:trigger factor
LKPFQVETEEELRKLISDDMSKSKEQQERQRLKNEIVSQLLENVDMELPETTVEQETRQTIQRIVQEQMMHGVSSEKLKSEHDAIYEAAKVQSSNRIKAGFILGEIAIKEDISVSAKEISEHIRAEAPRYRMTADQYRSKLEEHGAMDGFRENLLAEKVLDMLVEKAEITK